jgi:hypothetical protein
MGTDGEVTLAFPGELLAAIEEKMLPPLRDALAAPVETGVDVQTVDDVSLLLDMALAMLGRAHSLLTLPVDANARKEIADGIPRAWEGVYGRKLDALWKRRLIAAVDYVSRIVMVHVPSGARAQPKEDIAGRMVLEVVLPAMETALSPYVDELGALVEVWRRRDEGPPPGKYRRLADLYTRITGEHVTSDSIEKMFRRMRREPIWEQHERLLMEQARASKVHPQIRLELVSAEAAAPGGDMTSPPLQRSIPTT